jgi:YbbR domain-containing protein
MVTVSGAASRVAKVAHALVEDPSMADGELRIELDAVPVRPVTRAGETVPDVHVDPAEVAATIESVLVDSCAQVAVLPVYNDPPPGYYVAGIEVEPDHIQLRGDPGRLAAYREEAVVLTELIDISNSRTSVEALAGLDLPSEVQSVNGSAGVTVTILVSPFPGTRLIEIPVEAISQEQGLEVSGLSPSRVQVLLSGPLPELDALDIAGLRATVDVAGLDAGTHRLRPTIELPAGLRVRSVAPAEVDVRLGEATPSPG